MVIASGWRQQYRCQYPFKVRRKIAHQLIFFLNWSMRKIKMKTTFLKTAEISNKLTELITAHEEYYWAVAWGGAMGKHAKLLISNASRIKKIIIGTHFYHTDPKFLKKFIRHDTVKVDTSPHGSGTFHPKIYYFQSGGKAAAIVGSANFTKAAMNKNTEAGILIEGDATNDTLITIKDSVESYYANGKSITVDFLKDYSAKHEKMRSHRKASEKPLNTKGLETKLQDMTQQEYLKWVEEYGSDFDERLKILETIKEWLYKEKYCELKEEQRKAIAGTVQHIDGYHWNWKLFGSLIGSGKLKQILNNDKNQQSFSDALDVIPKERDKAVTYKQYKDFIDKFKIAFGIDQPQPKIPFFSRFLAVKRPDQFICVNAQNLKYLKEDIGLSNLELNVEEYWKQVVLPIRSYKWWNEPMPTESLDQRIWHNRVAMLDSLYYQRD